MLNKYITIFQTNINHRSYYIKIIKTKEEYQAGEFIMTAYVKNKFYIEGFVR